MNQLIAYLRDNLILDFQGDLSIEDVRDYLKGDDSRDSKVLLGKLVADASTNEMLLVLADCLAESVQKSITDDVMRGNLRIYSES